MNVIRLRYKFKKYHPDIYGFMDESKAQQNKFAVLIRDIVLSRYHVDMENEEHYPKTKERFHLLRRYAWELVQNETDYIRYRLLL